MSRADAVVRELADGSVEGPNGIVYRRTPSRLTRGAVGVPDVVRLRARILSPKQRARNAARPWWGRWFFVILTEFKVDCDASRRLEKAQADRLFALGEVVGHAYAAALGRFETRGTWKILVELYSPDEKRFPEEIFSEDDRLIGIAFVRRHVDIHTTALAGHDDTAAKLYLLELIHLASLAVGALHHWASEPFGTAYEAVAGDPRFRRARPWKANRQRTAKSRVVLEETADGAIAEIQVDRQGQIATYGPVPSRYVYLRGAWSMTRDLIWQGDSVILRYKNGEELMRVDGLSAPTPRLVTPPRGRRLP